MIPRSEYPRPQFVRESFINLNGEWEFEVDNSMSGKFKGFENKHLESKITVPFCPESVLSGIGNVDFMNCVWYRRELDIPEEWKNKRVILHFGAVDYQADVYINGKQVGVHKGGYSSFEFDITDYLADENYVTVCATDDTRSVNQPSGKQSGRYHSFGCLYTRTTGIWQTVWLEAVDAAYIKSAKYYPDVQNSAVRVDITPSVNGAEYTCRVSAYYEGRAVGEASVCMNEMQPSVCIKLNETHLWELGHGRLYDLKLELYENGRLCDTVESYFGLRSIGLDKLKFCLNGKSVFKRLVLDQGYYPDGIYTAPTDDALKNDIVNSMKLGFNGARLHEKIFEERFLYHADKLGYMVWGEFPNWGVGHTIEFYDSVVPEWLESVNHDFNHPALVGWCPLNEAWGDHNKSLYSAVYNITKATDPTRPVIDASGGYHSITDIFDIHDYTQNAQELKDRYTAEKFKPGVLTAPIDPENKHQRYGGEPVFMSEYGGIAWDTTSAKDAWGYGNAPKSEEEFKERYRALTEALLENPSICGFCYTQLYDVEQEVNGLMTYERKFKFDPEFFYKVNTQKAAIED